ncbi:MAG: helix-turn-helix transcriptional regulator [Alphaproteobacteria bacterium]|nr:helix-turn-helix transcriptional regulator [Alphaproteobacteria bacterium]
MQQFLYRGTPRRLPEDARYRLAAFLGIDQIQLADALFAKTPSTGDTLITGASQNRPRQFAVPFLDLSASAGGGAEVDIASETTSDPNNQWIFPRHWLARLGGRQPSSLRMISISGDSMVPLLEHDDTVMLDCSQTRPSPPGIFILDDGVGLVAKRLEIIPNTNPQMLRIASQNSAYSSYQRRIDEVHIIGRVVWFARRL